MIKRTARTLWHTYAVCCILFVTLLAAVIGLGMAASHFRYVELPNGVRLEQSILHDTGRNGFVLRDENGHFLLSTQGGEIAWQGDYVFGMGGRLTSGDEEGNRFVYKRGWEKPIIYTYGPDSPNFNKKYGLRGAIDYSPSLFQSQEYESCLQNRGRNDCKFEILNQYWWDVEDGKREPHKCRRLDPTEKCHSYSLYKTYLSLIEMPRYRRSWYQRF